MTTNRFQFGCSKSGRELIARLIFAVAAIGFAPAGLRAQGTLRDNFESSTTVWTAAGSDLQYRLDGHARVDQGAHSGKWCEHVRLTGDNGSFIYFSYPIGGTPVINELTATVWLRADRPGLQLLARVQLPRTIDPATKQPATMIVPGTSYTKVGIWQALSIAELPQLVERQARVLRTTIGPQVDTREAFVDQLVLNVYGGPGTTSVWIDDLEVTGVVTRPAIAGDVQLASAETSAPQRLPSTGDAAAIPANSATVSEVKLQGNVLLIGGRPFFPRIVPYHGEPLDRLKAIGFNTIKLPTLPTIELLDEAARHGLWLIAKPPSFTDLTTHNAAGGLLKISRDFDRVLVWDLGSGLSGRELDVIRPWVKALRAADPRSRPVICQADTDLRSYSRYVDVLSVERWPLGTSQELNEYGMWLRSRTQLARPGTPVWTTIQTQPTPRLVEQLALLSQGQPPRLNWQHEQLRLMVVTALAAGMRGICFESFTPLDADDSETINRALMLEWLNLELDLLQPWISSGSFVTAAECTDPHLTGVVLQTDRARLLLPLAISAQNQFAVDHGPTGAISFTVPGVSESNDAYELSPAGMRPLVRKRVTGGVRITLADADRTSPIVLTQDSMAIQAISRRATQLRPRLFELQRQVSSNNLALVTNINQQLLTVGRGLPHNEKLLASARARLDDSEKLASEKDLPQAEERARQALLALRQLERGQWVQAASAFSSPLASPFAVSFQTLPEHWRLVSELAAAGRGPNRLQSGDCESLEAMLGAGWRHLQHPQPGVTTSVDLAGENPHSGHYSLRMQATASDAKDKPQLVETPPMWITTAPVRVEAGELLQINAFVRVPAAIQGSVDGLLILDSLAGDALAERIRVTRDWQEVTLYRVAPQSSNLTVTFALTGFGEAWIDDVTVQAVNRSAAVGAQAMPLPKQ